MKKTGIVKAIRKDKKGLKIDDDWYNNYKVEIDGINKGDSVEVVYEEYKGKYYYSELNLTNKSNKTSEKFNPQDQRHLVDAGNSLEVASRLFLEGKYKTLIDASKDVADSFIYLSSLYQKTQLNTPNGG